MAKNHHYHNPRGNIHNVNTKAQPQSALSFWQQHIKFKKEKIKEETIDVKKMDLIIIYMTKNLKVFAYKLATAPAA
jgi:hypothetical protein